MVCPKTAPAGRMACVELQDGVDESEKVELYGQRATETRIQPHPIHVSKRALSLPITLRKTFMSLAGETERNYWFVCDVITSTERRLLLLGTTLSSTGVKMSVYGHCPELGWRECSIIKLSSLCQKTLM